MKKPKYNIGDWVVSPVTLKAEEVHGVLYFSESIGFRYYLTNDWVEEDRIFRTVDELIEFLKRQKNEN